MGRSFGMKAVLHWREIKNTAIYFFGSFEEPKELDKNLMPDENCIVCHEKEISGNDKSKFHGYQPHRIAKNLYCISCHSSHKKGEPDYYFLDMEKLSAECRKCHPQLSESFLVVFPENIKRMLPGGT